MLEFKEVSLTFADEIVLDRLSFRVERGEKAVFQAPSGKGKSTILNLILGFIKPDSGRIVYNGKVVTDKNIHQLRASGAWLPQDFQLGEGSVRNVILNPFSFKRNSSLKPNEETIAGALSLLGMNKKLLDKNFVSISEGQKQRVGMVICHLLQRNLILLDEPTSALDPESKKMVIDMFLKDEKQTVVSTSHDPDWVKYCNRVIPLKHERNENN